MYVTGLGWITAGGSGRGNSKESFDFSKGIIGDIAGIDFPVNPGFRKGRLDRFSLMGLQAITNALYDAGLYEWDRKRHTGMVASTIYGCLKTDLEFYDSVSAENGSLPEPNLFTHTLSNIFLGYASILFGLTGPNYILYEKSNECLSALLSAMECISAGECDIMLAGICDAEPPAGLPESEVMAPGSIFVVIEKYPVREKKNFGRLSMDSGMNILLNNKVINSIGMCVTECLKNRTVKE